jgi:GNAT superfamily N-acetyltransferase
MVPDAALEQMDIGERAKRWEKILAGTESETFVLESEDKIKGWISYGPGRDGDCADLGEIWALYVSPEHWREGCGRRLMAFAEEIAKDAQTVCLVLWVLTENARGRSFYDSVGYSPDGAIKKVEIGGRRLEEMRFRKRIVSQVQGV